MASWIKSNTQIAIFLVMDNSNLSSMAPIDILAMGAVKEPKNATTKTHFRIWI
jgi:hypothetical protein